MKNVLPDRHLPIVAIVGRPNVGKSTLFNRVVGKRKAVVHDTPGLTRDRNYSRATWRGRDFLLVDTGGFEVETKENIYRLMREQTMMAVEEAHVIIFLADVNEPRNPSDDEVIRILRGTRKPVLFSVNKCDNEMMASMAPADFHRFGSNDVYGISAAHGVGTWELLDAAVAAMPAPTDDALAEREEGIRIAVVGRQNVGKSTLVNKILGFERCVASDLAGTTRDAIDTTFQRDGQDFTLIDTAGIRRRGKVKPGVERLTVASAVMSMERCDVALVVLDGEKGLTEQDAHVAGYAVDAGCACIIVVNKWDAVEKDHKSVQQITEALHHDLGFLKYAPVITVSAKSGQRVDKLFEMILEAYRQHSREIETPVLNGFLRATLAYLSPPIRSGRQLKIKYVTQTGSHPPTFTFFVNDPKLLHFSYERYLINQLRREFGFEGTPVRLRFREKAEDRHDRPNKGGRA